MKKKLVELLLLLGKHERLLLLRELLLLLEYLRELLLRQLELLLGQLLLGEEQLLLLLGKEQLLLLGKEQLLLLGKEQLLLLGEKKLLLLLPLRLLWQEQLVLCPLGLRQEEGNRSQTLRFGRCRSQLFGGSGRNIVGREGDARDAEGESENSGCRKPSARFVFGDHWGCSLLGLGLRDYGVGD